MGGIEWRGRNVGGGGWVERIVVGMGHMVLNMRLLRGFYMLVLMAW